MRLIRGPLKDLTAFNYIRDSAFNEFDRPFLVSELWDGATFQFEQEVRHTLPTWALRVVSFGVHTARSFIHQYEEATAAHIWVLLHEDTNVRKIANLVISHPQRVRGLDRDWGCSPAENHDNFCIDFAIWTGIQDLSSSLIVSDRSSYWCWHFQLWLWKAGCYHSSLNKVDFSTFSFLQLGRLAKCDVLSLFLALIWSMCAE